MRRAQLLARLHLRRAVADPALRARLTPSYTMGCKRIVLSNTYYPALTRPNVEVLDLRHPRGARAFDRRRRGRRARGGRDHPGHRLPAHGPAAGRGRARPRGPHAARGLGGQPGGAPRHHRGRLPEPVPAARSQHGRRPHVGRLHDRRRRSSTSWARCASCARRAWTRSSRARRRRANTSPPCTGVRRERSGWRADAGAGTWTGRGGARRCGRTSPGATGGGSRDSVLTNTSRCGEEKP